LGDHLAIRSLPDIGTAWLRAKLVEGEEGPAIAGLIEELARVELAFIAAKSRSRKPS
jgi:hypothetical protein